MTDAHTNKDSTGVQNRVKDSDLSLGQKEQGTGRGEGLEKGRPGPRAHLWGKGLGCKNVCQLISSDVFKKQSNLKVLDNYNYPI